VSLVTFATASQYFFCKQFFVSMKPRVNKTRANHSYPISKLQYHKVLKVTSLKEATLLKATKFHCCQQKPKVSISNVATLMQLAVTFFEETMGKTDTAK